MPRIAIRSLLTLAVMQSLAAFAAAQDPIPVAYPIYPVAHFQHQPMQPGVNAFTPMYYPGYAPGYYPQYTTMMGRPEAGVQAPFMPPPYGVDCRHCRRQQGHSHSHGPIAVDSLPMHVYVRSPRDYFMFYENLEAERSRDLRPTLVP